MAKALSVRSESRAPGCLLWPFFSIFFVVGSVMFYFLTIRPLWSVMSADDWAQTPCTIRSSEVGVHDGDDGDTYSIDIVYVYKVNGQEHVSERYSFMGGFSSSGFKSKKAVVDQYPAGKPAQCFVDPDDPDSAVLNRELTSEMWWGLFPLPFFAVGLGGLIFLIRRSLKGPPDNSAGSKAPAQSLNRSASDDPDDSEVVVPVKGPDDDQPVELSAEASPGCRLFGAIFVALFWNGIVSVFVVEVVQDFQWFLALFLIPFVVIGLGLVGVVFYAFIALFNPRPKVTLSCGSIPLGGSATVSWRFTGNSNSIQRLKVSLRAQEEATYRRGTDTHTDTETLHEDVLVDAQGMMPEISQGSIEFTIPSTAMHSFESDNNEINWAIVFHGDIAYRPDVKTEFPIKVRPHEHT